MGDYTRRPVSYTHLDVYKRQLSYFTRVPEDLNDRLEKFMSRYGKEMPDKDVEIKKRQAQVCLLYTSATPLPRYDYTRRISKI